MQEKAQQEPQPGAPATDNRYAGWERLTADEQAARGPLLFAGLILTSDGVGAADVTVYDGQEVTGGRRFSSFNAASGATEVFTFPPVRFLRGLYIDIGSNVEDFVAFYKTLRE